uniref:pentatricopeptide repeat-containing protein At5g13270, chloroplastic n=1 Tax=Fragaria vesca subsp. vesca TaxID=101020 RepID=UPI0005CB42AD|nr:PREDICTED: pentatricopeptide repeat-containing protein At5g13270, chloroplastic [Fragaria vesca subsp. vesca]
MSSSSLTTVQSSLLLSCSTSHHNDKPPHIKSVNFSQIPSWVSLKSTSAPLLSTQHIQTGQVENVHLVSLSKQGKMKEAREFLKQMNEAGVAVTAQSYRCLFEKCGLMGYFSDGKFIHEWLRSTVKSPAEFLENDALKMYCDCGSLRDAQKVFDEMRGRDLVSWVIMISAYVESGVLSKAVGLFLDMLECGVRPNASIFTGLLKKLDEDLHLEFGKQMHSYVIRSGNGGGSVETAIGNMYVKCGWLDGARLVFDQMGENKSVVAWTGLMVGYTEDGKLGEVLESFAEMVRESVEVDDFVFSIVLKACAGLEELNAGRQIHGYSVKLGLDSEVSVGTPLVDFYVKCGEFESARRAFKRIDEPNDVSWSAIISGYCQNGQFEECLEIFQTLIGKGVTLNPYIYTSIFQACSAVADINFGAQVHADAIKRGFVAFLYGASAMITMYSKCGRLDYAYQAFESIDKPDTVAWTAIICGYAYHGNASEALRLFSRMQNSGIKPNSVTFIAVLTACSHSGLVTEAKQYLDSMYSVYNVEPTVDHYDCMIDVYSRAGRLQEAFELIKSMPFEPDAMSWKSLLGGCWIHRNLELGKFAAENLLQMDPEDTASYIIMFNLYASLGKWEEAARFRRMMVEKNLRKETGCSWITVKGETHRFIVGDKHHSQIDQIYSKLNELSISFKDDEDSLLTEEDVLAGFPERKEQLLDHSERLAIAFGLISTPSNAPIVVFKNIRACKDCHEFAKHVSMVTRRVIIVRDSNRFHHFKSGECSCRDYW